MPFRKCSWLLITWLSRNLDQVDCHIDSWFSTHMRPTLKSSNLPTATPTLCEVDEQRKKNVKLSWKNSSRLEVINEFLRFGVRVLPCFTTLQCVQKSSQRKKTESSNQPEVDEKERKYFFSTSFSCRAFFWGGHGVRMFNEVEWFVLAAFNALSKLLASIDNENCIFFMFIVVPLSTDHESHCEFASRWSRQLFWATTAKTSLWHGERRNCFPSTEELDPIRHIPVKCEEIIEYFMVDNRVDSPAFRVSSFEGEWQMAALSSHYDHWRSCKNAEPDIRARKVGSRRFELSLTRFRWWQMSHPARFDFMKFSHLSFANSSK